MVEDISVGVRAADVPGGLRHYPNYVLVNYDPRPNFEHALSSVSDPSGRSLTFSNCEWAAGHCSVTTTQLCNTIAQCPSNQTCVANVAKHCNITTSRACTTTSECPASEACTDNPGPIVDACIAGSKSPTAFSASSRSAVATNAVTVPVFANNKSALDPTRNATYGFFYKYAKVTKPTFEDDGSIVTSRPVLELQRLDYPSYTRPSGGTPQQYSMYFGYNNTGNGAFGLGGDYGEVGCRTTPLQRNPASGNIIDNACYRSGPWATFNYNYGYYKYLAATMSGWRPLTTSPNSGWRSRSASGSPTSAEV
jgi:hypothetical protein